MKKWLFVIFFMTAFVIYVFADISKNAQVLENLRCKIIKDGLEEDKQKYLNEFPKTFDEFKQIFYGRPNVFDELYEKYSEHLNLLNDLVKNYESEVIEIWLSIAKNAYWDADAIGHLQHQITEFISSHLLKMAQILMKKNESERVGIIRFLADIENFNGYKPYETILKGLKGKKGFSELYKLFYNAKQERMKHRHG